MGNKIKINHITRVEGHGNIIVDVKDGKIEKVLWEIIEAPRFFEAMVRGRHYTEVARITSRICGICSVGHSITSVKATENALKIEISEQTEMLRKILLHSENFDSHILHIYFLVAPDLFGVPSVFPLLDGAKEVVLRALKMKNLAHQWGAILAGRTTHPTKIIPGGFSFLPTMEDLKRIKEIILELIPDIEETVKLVSSVLEKVPKFERETEYMALYNGKEYALYDGEIQTVLPDGKISRYPVEKYKECTKEYLVSHSTAKFTKNNLESLMVGALARFNNNYKFLHKEAKMVAEKFGLKPLCFNPFFNTIAQVVECVHSLYDSLDLIEVLLKEGIKEENIQEPKNFGKGIAVVEVPRGILMHEYEYDEDGFCKGANCIIPTNQNHGNIQKDMESYLPFILKENIPQKELELKLKMLVRAYDPCISCSTHFLKVNFK